MLQTNQCERAAASDRPSQENPLPELSALFGAAPTRAEVLARVKQEIDAIDDGRAPADEGDAARGNDAPANFSPQTPFSEQVKELLHLGRYDEVEAMIRQRLAQDEREQALKDQQDEARRALIADEKGDIFPHGGRKGRKKSQRVVRKALGDKISQVFHNRVGEKIDLSTALLPEELATHPSASEEVGGPAVNESPLQEAAEIEGIAPRPVRRGRPLAIGEFQKGKLVGLMTHGLTFRQAAAMLGVDHKTLLNTMKRDPELAVEVADARLAAIARPLMKVIQESQQSWRAATWLIKYLDERLARVQEETPEERDERWERRETALREEQAKQSASGWYP